MSKGKEEVLESKLEKLDIKDKPEKKDVNTIVFEELYTGLKRVIKSPEESRFLTAIVRRTFSMRKKLKPSHFNKLLGYLTDVENRDEIVSYLSKVSEQQTPTEMDISNDENKPEPSSPKLEDKFVKLPSAASLEISLFLHLFAIILLIDDKKNNEAAAASSSLIERIRNNPNRTSIFPLTSKAYFYYSWSHELINKLADIRSTLLAAYRSASLQHDWDGQLAILNLLLRNYLHYNLVEQAEKLLSKVTLSKEAQSSNNQMARYLFYQGRIKSIQLEYTKAENCLSEAIRKSPQGALGFKLLIHKWLCIVQLLIGDIPDRRIFRQTGMEKALEPYYRLTKAVRFGDLEAFQNVVKQFQNAFTGDNTISLIRRLRNNVIKTGLRKINVAYSRISFSDICDKLKLDSVEDAEYIVSKAIRDGVIDATIDRKGGFVRSNELLNVYSTYEPSESFHKRIEFCLGMRNDSIKAMRYSEQEEIAEVLITNEERQKREEVEKKRREEEEKKEKEEEEKNKRKNTDTSD